MSLFDYCLIASFAIGFVAYIASGQENVTYGIVSFAVLLPLCGIINWFGSDDPNSFFVRKQLLILCPAEIIEVGNDKSSKGYVVGKGNFFEDNDLLCLEVLFTDANGSYNEIPTQLDYLTFGEKKLVYSHKDHRREFLVKLPAEKSNLFLPKYHKKTGSDAKALKENQEYYEKIYDSYIFKEEDYSDDYDW